MGGREMNVDIDEPQLSKWVAKAVDTLRLPLNKSAIANLTREIFTLASPQREDFKAGDSVVWMHAYDKDEYPACKGSVLYWNETQTRVRIKYVNTLFDNPVGAEAEAWVYSRELVRLEDYVEPKPKLVPEEADGGREEEAAGAAGGAAGQPDSDGRLGGEDGSALTGPGGPAGTTPDASREAAVEEAVGSQEDGLDRPEDAVPAVGPQGTHAEVP